MGGIYIGSRRFEITETAGSVKGFYVVVDRETGVNYLVAKFGTGGGICPLIDKDGKPIISEPSQSTVKMNGAYAPPLTAPPAFADRQSRGDSKECCRPFP